MTPVRRTKRSTGKPRYIAAGGLARGQRADRERHHQREHAEVDRPERADQEDDDEADDAGEMDRHDQGVTAAAPARAGPGAGRDQRLDP